MDKKFYFGSVYIIEAEVPREKIIEDLKLIKESGFNLITLWPAANSWLCDEPTEFKYDDTLWVLDHCQEFGMEAIIQLFGQNHSQEFLPDAIVDPEMLLSLDTPDDANCIWANLNHPKVRKAMNHYLKDAVNTLKSHPAIFAWDVFNEAHFRSDDPWTIAEYQKWLENKYKDIALLNKKWYRRYKSFDQITPHFRRAPYSIWSSLLPAVEYEMFRSDNLNDICQWLYDEVKKHDIEHPVIIDGTSGHILYPDVTLRNNNEFKTADIPDIYGGTFYPKSWGRNLSDDPWKCSLYFGIPSAAAQSSGKDYFVNELQTHTQSVLTPGTEVEPEELALWTWMNIACGAKGIQLWRWRPFRRGYQATGRGLTQINGQSSPRRDKIAEIVEVIQKNEASFANSKTLTTAVKIAVSYRGRLFHDALHKWKENELPDCIGGWYRAFWESGVTTSLANLDNLSEKDLDTPVIVLPSTLRVPAKTIDFLERYVEAGGTLIADARLGTLNDWGEVPQEGLPGKCLEKLFGFRETDVMQNLEFEFCGELIKAPFMSQIIEVDDTVKIIAQNESGSPAVISRDYGKGEILYFNSFMGLHWQNGLNSAQKDFFRALVLKREPKQIYAKKSSSVSVNFHNNGNEMLVFVMNFSTEESEIFIHNHLAVNQPESLSYGRIELSNNCFKCHIPAKETAIFRWQTKPAIPPIISLSPNRIWRTYQGGLELDRMSGKNPAEDSHFPEDWIASTTPAINKGREHLEYEGLSTVVIDEKEYLLKDLISSFPEIMVGEKHYKKFGANIGFLLKFLDPAIRLHVQCHPTIEFAKQHLNSNSGKTEGYIILGSRDEVKDPYIYFGFENVPDKAEFKKAIENQDADFICSCLKKIPVKPGDVFLVPGGQPHAIGEGVFMMEIMEPTDFAVRIEFKRGGYVLPESARFMDRDVDFALSMFEFNKMNHEKHFIQPMELERQNKSVLYSLFDERYTKCFAIKKLSVKGKFIFRNNSFSIIVVIDGKGNISAKELNIDAEFGDQFFIPNETDIVEFNSPDEMEIIIASRN